LRDAQNNQESATLVVIALVVVAFVVIALIVVALVVFTLVVLLTLTLATLVLLALAFAALVVLVLLALTFAALIVVVVVHGKAPVLGENGRARRSAAGGSLHWYRPSIPSLVCRLRRCQKTTWFVYVVWNSSNTDFDWTRFS
jgi:hypothetical protein